MIPDRRILCFAENRENGSSAFEACRFLKCFNADCFLLFLLYCSHLFPLSLSVLVCRQSDENRQDALQKNKTWATKAECSRKGRWTAGYLSFQPPRCRLIAADILPLLSFQSEVIWCIASLCLPHKRRHVWEMPSSPRASDVPPNGLIISQFAAAELSGLRQTRQILPILSGGAKSQVPLIWLPAGGREKEGERERLKSQEEPLRLKLVPTCCCLTSDGEEIFCYDCFVFHLLVINSRVTSEDATLFLYLGSTVAQHVDLLVSLLNKSVVSSQKTGIHRNSEVSPDAPSRLQPSGKFWGWRVGGEACRI